MRAPPAVMPILAEQDETRILPFFLRPVTTEGASVGFGNFYALVLIIISA
jgi:hypothetical protein